MAVERENLSVINLSQKRFVSLQELEVLLGWSRGFVEGLFEQKGYPFYVLCGKNLVVSISDLKKAAELANLDITTLNVML